MNVILFGATGMIGQGVLRECLLDPDVKRVLSVGRSASGQKHSKLQELVRPDLLDLAPVSNQLSGFDACFFCLGVSSAGMTEAAYRHITYDITLAVARTLVSVNPAMTFIYISGLGSDSTERGRTMWARVKGETENALLRLPFKATYIFRPAGIIPRHGIKSRTRIYRLGYALARPLFPLLQAVLPAYVTTTEKLALAMIKAAKQGAPKAIIESRDFASI